MSKAPISGAQSAPVDAMRVWLRFVRLQQRLSHLMAARLREIGLSIPQFDVLSTLTQEEGVTQQALAERLYVTKGNVSGLIDRLVEAGLVERHPLPGDRRSHALHLTPRGHELASQGIALQRAFVARTLGALPPGDIAALDKALLGWRDLVRDAARGEPA
jgi:DNA-binding MarR family transcriptional regulator